MQSFKCAHIEQPVPDVGGFLAHPINVPNGFKKKTDQIPDEFHIRVDFIIDLTLVKEVLASQVYFD